jgi:hypothetical protein
LANGRVCTGFSLPKVAKYTVSSGTVSYTNVTALARGVDVTLSIESASDNKFYADNVLAESENQAFSSGSLSLTVDGLKDTARQMITGVATTSSTTVSTGVTVTWDVYDDAAVVPYVGVGFVARYMEDNVTSFVPIVLKKCKFSDPEISAATQEESIDWQTQTLEAEIMRDDSSSHAWRMIGTALSTEAQAETAVLKALGAT